VDGRAVYFDGQTNRKHSVVLRLADRIEIVEQEAVVAAWPFADVRRADGPPTALLRLACISGLPLARLEVEDEATKQEIVSHCPSLAIGRGGSQIARIVFWSLAAACSIFGLAAYASRSSRSSRAFRPAGLGKPVGEAVDRQIRVFINGKACSALDGQAALATLVGKLRSAGGIDNTLEPLVGLRKSQMRSRCQVERFICWMGFWKRRRIRTKLAGILAHELAHVKHRDGCESHPDRRHVIPDRASVSAM